MIYTVNRPDGVELKCTDHPQFSYRIPGLLSLDEEYRVPVGYTITAAEDHMRVEHIALAANAA